MTALSIPEPVRDLLRRALLDESDLVEFLRHAHREPVPHEPDQARCSGSLPVRRALDPETSQLRLVEVTLRRSTLGWEVVQLDGLDAEG